MSSLLYRIAVPALAAALSLAPAASAQNAGQVLTPERAVSVALDNSPVLGSSAAQARQARWSLRSEETRFDPTLLLDTGITRTQNPSMSTSGTAVPKTDSATVGAELRKKYSLGTDVSLRLAGTWQQTQMASMPGQNSMLTMGPGYGLSAKLGLTQPLLRGAGSEYNRSTIKAAEADQKAAVHGEENTASTLARDTLNAYAELWYAARNVGVQTRSLEVASNQRNDAVQREKTGSMAQADVLSFETTVATRQESVLEAERDQTSRKLELVRVMGAAPASDFALVDELAIPPSEQGDLVGEAMASSKELLQLEDSLQAATIRAKVAADPYRSRLDLDAYVQVQGLGNKEVYPAFSQMVGGNAWSAHVGLTYELPISGKRDAEIRKAQAAVDAAQKSLTAAQTRIRAEVETLVLQERAARTRSELADRTVVIARQAADAQRARMQTGTATALQVIQADNEVRAAELRALRARVDAYEAVMNLRRATGRLVQYTASR